MTRQADGVIVRVYSDGSGPTLAVLNPASDLVQEGINERLYASRCGEALGTNLKATTLEYKRGVGWSGLNYLVIWGNLGRSFPPQPWARGVLPIVSVSRVLAFYDGGPRSLLEFAPFQGWSDEAARAVGAATWLILSGWDHGFVFGPRRTQDLLRILSNLGLGCSARQFRESIAPFVESGRIEETWLRTAPKHDKVSAGWRATQPTGGRKEADEWLSQLASAFEPFLLVKGH